MLPVVGRLATRGRGCWQRVIENEHRNWSGDPYVGPGHRLANQARFDSCGATTGSVYLGDSKYLYALDPIHGVERWRFQLSTPDNYFSTSPSVGAFGVYLEDHGRLSMLDPETGDPHWVFERSVGSVRLRCRVCHAASDVVYVVSADNALYALDARTGGVQDRFEFAPAPSAAALFEPILQEIRSGFVRIAEGEATLLRKHAATAQAAAVLSSVEHRLGAYRHHSLSEEERTTELTAIGALLDLLRPRSDLVDQPVANKSGMPRGSVFQLLSPIPVKCCLRFPLRSRRTSCTSRRTTRFTHCGLAVRKTRRYPVGKKLRTTPPREVDTGRGAIGVEEVASLVPLVRAWMARRGGAFVRSPL